MCVWSVPEQHRHRAECSSDYDAVRRARPSTGRQQACTFAKWKQHLQLSSATLPNVLHEDRSQGRVQRGANVNLAYAATGQYVWGCESLGPPLTTGFGAEVSRVVRLLLQVGVSEREDRLLVVEESRQPDERLKGNLFGRCFKRHLWGEKVRSCVRSECAVICVEKFENVIAVCD